MSASESIRAAARRLGVSDHALHYRMKGKGMTLAQAASYPFAAPARGPGTITQRAKLAGLKPSTVLSRMRRDKISAEDALEMSKNLKVRCRRVRNTERLMWQLVEGHKIIGRYDTESQAKYALGQARLRAPKR